MGYRPYLCLEQIDCPLFMTTFADLKLHKNLMKSLEKLGFDTPTEIQAQFIPQALMGNDVMASAQTGSGKTAAFLLPAFQKFLENPDESRAYRRARGPRVLVLTPTRELAAQVMKVATELRHFTSISVGSVTGGMPIAKQQRMLKETIDVLVGTPGRLIDLMNRGDLLLDDIDTFIIDEADRMLDMGFSDDVLKISAACGSKRQAMLLSATLDGGDIQSVVAQVMHKPIKIELTHAAHKHENITQCMYRAKDFHHKVKLLEALLQDQAIWQMVIFCGTKTMTEKLTKKLREDGWEADALHGDMRQSARNRSIRGMQSGKTKILVATDVAARGLDIKEMTHVINFDLPQNSEDYIHRIGRVGRGGKQGHAISLVSKQQWGMMMQIERMMANPVLQKEIKGLEYVPEKKKKGGEQKKSAKPKARKPKNRKDIEKNTDAPHAEKLRKKNKRGEKPPKPKGGKFKKKPNAKKKRPAVAK